MTFRTETVLDVGPRDHVVVFYASEPELTDHVGDYLFRAVTSGEAALVFATPAHREAFAARLARAGVDLAAAEADGGYLALDAARTLESFMTGGCADAAKFWAEISPAMRRAAQAGRPVRAFGEMVSLLWAAGLVSAAIEVEAMWNELIAQYSFSLVCAYPASVAEARDSDALSEVYRAHSLVVGSPPRRARGWHFR